MHRLNTAECTLVVVDMQERLLAAMPDASSLIRNVAFLIDCAKLLEIPILAAEQYPKGLGPTHAELAQRLPSDRPAKTAFSCCGSAEFFRELVVSNRRQVVLTGIETHVCLMQTAFDLIKAGIHVFLPVDATMSRFSLDRDTAIQRLDRAGVVLTTSEAVPFEWMADASHPQFKAMSKLVIERSQAMAEGRRAGSQES